MVDVYNAEGWIDGGLVRIGGGAVEIVDVEAGEELVFGRDLVVEAEGELVGIGVDLGGGGVGTRAEGAGGLGYIIYDEDGERIRGSVGVSDRVNACALVWSGNRHDLSGTQHLAEALELDEVVS